MTDDETLDSTNPSADSLSPRSGTTPNALCLVVLWCRQDPDLPGALTWAPTGSTRRQLGRGDSGDRRVTWVRSRPDGETPCPAPSSPRISRQHLCLYRDGEGLAMTVTGQLAVRVNATPTTECRLQPGDLIEIDRELLLLCESRPIRLPPGPVHAFGTADADGLVGESPAAWRLRRQVAFHAATTSHTLIRGASGTGKELIAQALHRQSSRAGPLISRNAATFPEGIIDAELFGNAPNYPNPGMPGRAGAIGEADGGCLFLDEIGELPQQLQTHLLRVLDSGEYVRLGEAHSRAADVKVIGATNRALSALKHDVLARFTQRIQVPDLHERRADIPLIARHLIQVAVRDNPTLFSGTVPVLHPRLVRYLVQHRYTTHVRELNRLLWQALEQWSTTGGKYLDLKGITLPEGRRPPPTSQPEAISREDILAAYRRFGGVQARVPAHLGLRDRFQLKRLEKKLGITAEDKAAALKE